MGFTEKYVKPDSAAWVNATVYTTTPVSQVLGSDTNNYYCILAHTSETGVKGRPIDGTNWATYWAVADGTTEQRAWNITQMAIAVPAAGTRVNILTGTYTKGVWTMPTGTVVDPIFFRGYNSAIGDLDSQDALSSTANFPDLTITGLFTFGPGCFFQNLDITGALASYLIGSGLSDDNGFINCRVINTQNDAAASCVQGDNDLTLIRCDISCTGAAHGVLVDADLGARIAYCRFKMTATADCINVQTSAVFIGCTFHGNGNASSIGIDVDAMPAGENPIIDRCTFYNLGTALRLPNVVAVSAILLTNNHVTDCAKYIDNLYVTDEDVLFELNNRTRDNITPRTGVFQGVLAGEVITDTGGAETDYVNAGAGDFNLISGAPGINAATLQGDIGAWQRIPDFPTAANTWHNDTTDGVTGSMSGLDVPKTGGTGSTLLAEDVATGVTLDPTGDNVTGTASGGSWTPYYGYRGRLRYFGYDLAYS